MARGQEGAIDPLEGEAEAPLCATTSQPHTAASVARATSGLAQPAAVNPMGKVTGNAFSGAAIVTAVVAAALLTFRWFAPPRAMTVRAPDPEAADTVRQEFRDLSILPRVIATIPIRKPPPTPDKAYVIPRTDEGEHVEPEPVVEASVDLPAYLKPPHDICARNGGRKVTYMRRHHETWRCVYRRRG